MKKLEKCEVRSHNKVR